MSSSQPTMSEVASDAVVELSSRLVYSLLRPVVRTAARFRMPIDRLVELTKLAYFEEYRAKAPRDLDFVARSLGVSYRTAVNFNRAARDGFFRPEKDVEPLRRICGALVSGPKTLEALAENLGDLDAAQIQRGLYLLGENQWVKEDPKTGTYALQEVLRSYVSDDVARRVDGLNNLLDVVADAVWSRFLGTDDEPSLARTWVFAAKPEAIRQWLDEKAREVRHQVVDLEENALADDGGERFGVAFISSPMKEQ